MVITVLLLLFTLTGFALIGVFGYLNLRQTRELKQCLSEHRKSYREFGSRVSSKLTSIDGSLMAHERAVERSLLQGAKVVDPIAKHVKVK